jgi:hypothetical protein
VEWTLPLSTLQTTYDQLCQFEADEDTADRLIILAARFANAVDDTILEEIERRSKEFGNLLAAESLTQARQGVKAWLERTRAWYLTQPAPGTRITKYHKGRLMSLPVGERPKLDEIERRLLDTDAVVWDLTNLQREFAGSNEKDRYREELHKFDIRRNCAYLFGSYAIRECQRVSNPDMGNSSEHDALVRNLYKDFQTSANAILDAARDLMAHEGKRTPPGAAGRKIRQWYHGAGEEPRDKYFTGDFLEGTLRDLSMSLPTNSKLKDRRDARRVKRAANSGEIWVSGGGHRFKVYFKTKQVLEAARARLETWRDSTDKLGAPDT